MFLENEKKIKFVIQTNQYVVITNEMK